MFFSSFLAQLLSFEWNGPILLAVLYRPLGKDFIFEFTELMGYITTNYDRFILVGDFNVHVCCPSNSLSNEFLRLTESFNLQWVNEPTHLHGHTLYLVLT